LLSSGALVIIAFWRALKLKGDVLKNLFFLIVFYVPHLVAKLRFALNQNLHLLVKVFGLVSLVPFISESDPSVICFWNNKLILAPIRLLLYQVSFSVVVFYLRVLQSWLLVLFGLDFGS
jgi:hypothetical protein